VRIITSIALFLAGCGLIAYSYIGAFFTLANEVEWSLRNGNDDSAFAVVVDFILSGEVPQMPGFFYFGLLLIAFSVVNLIRNRTNK
jgi:hypothetical protein